jgi:hypothetical protein
MPSSVNKASPNSQSGGERLIALCNTKQSQGVPNAAEVNDLVVAIHDALVVAGALVW